MEDYKNIDDYYFKPTGKPLGKGAFATVFKGYQGLETKKEVAIKVIPAVKMLESQENYDLFMREIEVLRQIKGEHIVQLLDVKRTPNNLYMFTEFCNGGDLDAYLKKNGSMSEEQALEIMYQFSNAFNTINSLDIKNSAGRRVIIMHRDIKTANILFHNGIMKIADFGFAKMIDEASKNVKMQHTLLGTPLYMAPQILNDESYTSKCDIWSAGVLFYECLFKKLPWNGTSIPNLHKNIKAIPLKFPKQVGDDTRDLLEKMLQIDEAKRISWKEIEDHPAIKAGEKTFLMKYPKKVPEKEINDKITDSVSEATIDTKDMNMNTNSSLANGEVKATTNNPNFSSNPIGMQTQNQVNPSYSDSNQINFLVQNQIYVTNLNGSTGVYKQNFNTTNTPSNLIGYLPQNQPGFGGNSMGFMPQNQVGMPIAGSNTFGYQQQQQPNNYITMNTFPQPTLPQKNSQILVPQTTNSQNDQYQNYNAGYQQQPGLGNGNIQSTAGGNIGYK